MTTKTRFRDTSMLPARYFERHDNVNELGHWNVKPTALMEHRIMLGWGLARRDHGALAVAFAVAADGLKRARMLLGELALLEHGDHGPLISGVIRDHFPVEVKDALRVLAHNEGELRDAAGSHSDASAALAAGRTVEE